MTWNEGDHPLDNAQDITSENNARGLSILLFNWMKKNGDQFDSNSTYLALGAGQGTGEMTVAQELGIPIDADHITFLDKALPPDTEKTRPLRRGIKQTMASFLAQPPTTRYNLVTAFGMEYVIDPKTIESVLTALAPHLHDGAYILINPFVGNKITLEGFDFHTPYPQKDIRPVMYRYRGKPGK